ncbi:MAG: hypothetical protein R2764_09180 [Bacteroidales bacterium]
MQKQITSSFDHIIILTILIIDFNIKYYNNPRKILEADVLSYYAYLPAAFIYRDLSFNFIHEDIEKYNKIIWLFPTATGKSAIITSMGLSYLYTPFFIIAHWVTPALPGV